MACLTDWMMRQRWYGGKGRVPTLRRIGAWELPSDTPGVRVRTLLVMDDAASPPALYQIPVTRRDTLLPGGGLHLIGRLDSGEFLYDGPHDPAYTRALLRMIVSEQSALPDGASAAGHASRGAGLIPGIDHRIELGSGITSTVLSGEQSNTSIIYDLGATDAVSKPIICKIFRTLHHGENPDVVLQTALTEAGSPYVPRSVGSVTGEWDDVGRSTGRAQGHFAFAQEFLPGVADAWRVALRAAEAGEDFSEPARELGAATARVHRTLAKVLPTRAASIGDIVAAAASWHARLSTAIAEVPGLARHRQDIEAVYDRAQAASWPRMQRIHGDYHLGQVIRVPGRGWVLLDFEGEPLRPLYERDLPDFVLRDIAGMLRSFDYVTGSIANDPPGLAADAWAHAAREAFVAGYAAVSDLDLPTHQALLDAFELDKALYEAVYEVRNRPDWLHIPVGAIRRLLLREAADASQRG